MNKKKNIPIADKLERAYYHLLLKVSQYIQDKEDTAEPFLNEVWTNAKATLNQIESLSEQEIETISLCVRRDTDDLSQFFTEAGEFMHDQLMLDWQYVEENLLNLVLQAADRARLEQLSFHYHLLSGGTYHTGQLIGLGSLHCEQCSQPLRFHKISHIPPCPSCHNTSFIRVKA